MKTALLVIFGTILFTTAITLAERKEPLTGLNKVGLSDIPSCKGRPEFITEVRPEIIGGFEKLPELILIAQEADYYIESRDSSAPLKLHSYQSFAAPAAKEKSKIICGSSKNIESFRTSLFAPTLIDTTPEKTTGQSLWQFQLLADGKSFSVWNKRSLAYSGQENLERELLKFGGNYRIYQLSGNQYEVVVSKEDHGLTQYLSIKYDAVKSL